MCGGLVATVSGKPSGMPALLYHAGRLSAYAVLGALAATFGNSLNHLGLWVGIRRFAPLMVGLLLLAQAVFILRGSAGIRPHWLARLSPRWTARVARAAGVWKFPVLGALTALLPCGWLYGFVVLAMAAPDALTGALSLLVFGLGTLPALMLLGEALRRLVVRLGWAPSFVTSILLILAGTVSLAQHVGWVPNPVPHFAPHSVQGEPGCSHS